MAFTSSLFSAISDRWFLTEPLLFAGLYSHRLVENSDMECAMRSGKLRLEYNPDRLSTLDNLSIELLLRREVVRILLKHPYQRMPMNPNRELLTLASDITIRQHGGSPIAPSLNWPITLPPRLSFEEYYNLLAHMQDDSEPEHNESAGDSRRGESESSDRQSGNGGLLSEEEQRSNADASALWEEDDFISERLNSMIENAVVTKQWGSLSTNAIELLKVSMEKSLNVRRQLALFKTSILSNQRRLTRMRPSRRYGWSQMGVIHPYTTKLLIAIDTSGSIDNKDLKRFFGIINSFFSFGVPFIDVIQFDRDVKLPVLSFKKATYSVKVKGRGGTNFQPPVDFFEKHKDYDGMIVLTDGYAPKPQITARRRILWALKDRSCYNQSNLAPKIYL